MMADLFDDKTITPMLIDTQTTPFDDSNYLFELKLDGERCLAYLSDQTEFRNKRHKKMNAHVPELCQIHRQAKKRCILDGELIVMAEGAPNFFEIQRRSLTTNSFKIEQMARKNPATFTAFDILYYDGKDITEKPLIERKKILEKAFTENEKLSRMRFVEHSGIALYDYAKEQNLEGIVAKRRDSVYNINKRTKDWIKIKNLKDEDFVVCGYILKEENNTASVVLGAYFK